MGEIGWLLSQRSEQDHPPSVLCLPSTTDQGARSPSPLPPQLLSAGGEEPGPNFSFSWTAGPLPSREGLALSSSTFCMCHLQWDPHLNFLHVPPSVGTTPKETTLGHVTCALYTRSSVSSAPCTRRWQAQVPWPQKSPHFPRCLWGFISYFVQDAPGPEGRTEGV